MGLECHCDYYDDLDIALILLVFFAPRSILHYDAPPYQL